ncbi:hypothetical protein LMTR13_17590 [Bradyrhizobium icense]|uniref:Uncharacterized protein n=1 Tax=Bradyrhizobium icense TaxID=1274631 RepID=A0A1B1UG16_9BRAD|nr:hypothetical protein LMTR13_17590 [Bradyrhizobium icense]
MTDVCREFGISGKTGYKIFDRYKTGRFERSQLYEIEFLRVAPLSRPVAHLFTDGLLVQV